MRSESMEYMDSINRVDGVPTQSKPDMGSINRVDGVSTQSKPDMESINRVDGVSTRLTHSKRNRIVGAPTRSMQSKGKEEYKTYQHNPPHLFIPNAKYFITVSTYKGKPYLKLSAAKKRLYRSLQKEFTRYHWVIEDWVILNNHYHLMVNAPEDSNTLPNIFREVHRFTALWIKKSMDSINRVDGMSTQSKHNMDSINRVDGMSTWLTHSKKGKIFYNYWDTCITYEKSYFTRLNYIWYNPVKHGYVDSPEKWEFGSYFYRFKEEAEEMNQLMKKYPFDNIKVRDDY